MICYFRPAGLIAALLVPISSTLAAVPEALAKIPFELHSYLPTTKVTIGGISIPLFIDLGGYKPIALTKGALRKVQVKYLGTSDTSKDAAGVIHESRRFMAPDVTMAGASFGELQGAEFSFPEGATEADPRGYIGFGLLKNYLLVFDYPAGVLRLYPSGETRAIDAECGSQQFQFQVMNGVVQTTIETNKGKLVFHLDTGSTSNILRPSSIGEAGKSLQSFSKFKLGEKELGPIVFELREFGAPAVDGVLGTEFFQSKVVCLDVKTGLGALR